MIMYGSNRMNECVIMKVLFFGQTGINKRQCVERLASKCLAVAGHPDDLEHTRAMEHIRGFHVEDFIASAGDYISYLDLFYAKRQADVWGEAWDSVMAKLDGQSPEHVFITLHATYFRKNRFFSVIDLNRIGQFNPDMIITIIDDAHECWDKVRVRELEHPRGIRLRLRDVFLWRTVEIMAGDFLVHGLGIPHFVVAAKHPSEMIQRLIFEPTTKRIYASFPISSTRSNSDSRSEVDAFRFKMHEQFTVFDPLTIDERILVSAYKDRTEGQDLVEVALDSRWPTGFTGSPGPFESMSPPYESAYPIIIPIGEMEETIEDIDRQIEARDYRLIDQVEAVAAFRPDYHGRQSRGVTAELQYAAQTAGIPVHLARNDEEDGPYATSPFGQLGTRHSSVEELIAALSP